MVANITNNFSTPAVPAASLHITTGRGPFTGFLTAQEGSAPPFVADVARLYASKLKDALVSAARYSQFLFPSPVKNRLNNCSKNVRNS